MGGQGKELNIKGIKKVIKMKACKEKGHVGREERDIKNDHKECGGKLTSTGDGMRVKGSVLWKVEVKRP